VPFCRIKSTPELLRVLTNIGASRCPRAVFIREVAWTGSGSFDSATICKRPRCSTPSCYLKLAKNRGIAGGLRYHATSSRHSCRTFARMSKQSASGLQALPVRLARFIAAPSLPSSA
jgi:hypothetical protein